jgi:zinc-ribbon domain
VFCPRCGKPNEEGARYCSACGEALPELGEEAGEASEPPSLGQRAGRLIGRSRRERLITAAITIALGIAVVAVIFLVTDGDQDEYVARADLICVESKQALAIVEDRVSEARGESAAALALYGGATAEVVADWRSRLARLDPPSDRQEAASQLDEALAKVDDEASQAARQAQAGEDLKRLRARLAAAGARAEQAIEALGLDACAEGGLGIGELQTG